jgi:hypothetical protein
MWLIKLFVYKYKNDNYIIRIMLKEYDKHCVLNTLNSVCLEVEKYLELTW